MATDSLTAPPVVVINQTMATAPFPNSDAIGQRLAVAGTTDWAEIVGIADDVRPLNITATAVPFQVYKPFAQEAWQYVTLSVRAADPALAPTLLPAIRRVIASLDPDQPIVNLLPVPERIGRNLSGWDTINRLLIGFSGLGLLLSALGVYGAITRLVLQRTNEIGIRMALGATPRSVTSLVLGDGLRTALLGSVIGLAGTGGLARYFNATLPAFGGNPLGPAALASGILFLIALGACLRPVASVLFREATPATRSGGPRPPSPPNGSPKLLYLPCPPKSGSGTTEDVPLCGQTSPAGTPRLFALPASPLLTHTALACPPTPKTCRSTASSARESSSPVNASTTTAASRRWSVSS